MEDNGISALFKNLDSLPEKVEIALTRKGLKEISGDLVNQAKSLAPVRVGEITMRKGKTHSTKNRRGKFGSYSQGFQGAFSTVGFYTAGSLRDSITSLVRKSKKAGGIILSIGSGVFYARFVEFGFVHFAKKGSKTHVPARPFLTPVLESAYGTVMNKMRTFLETEVPKQMTKINGRK